MPEENIYQRVKPIFQRALELRGEARSDFVRSECQDDQAALDLVVQLLEAHDQTELGLVDHAVQKSIEGDEGVGTEIDRYTLVSPLGQGGFGTVWRADQHQPVRRTIALKILKLGMDTAQVVARFQAERQALAVLDHPHIAKVLDGGATRSGRPYFAMELVAGDRITTFCDQHNLDIEARLTLFVQVCKGIQHAHLRGIIHRDLKPSNILVEMREGSPHAKVIDFGIAKATSQELSSETIITGVNQVMGTPAYMSPEQAQLFSIHIDSRTDIYSLGAVLYELLTGATPHEISGTLTLNALRFLHEVDPTRPSTRIASESKNQRLDQQRQFARGKQGLSVRGDIDNIVMKALEKEPDRRYQSANDFAEDIQRALRHEPVHASSPRILYRLQKFTRRNRRSVGATALVLLVLSVATTILLTRLEAERVMGEVETLKAAELSLVPRLVRELEPNWNRAKVILKEELDSENPESRTWTNLAIALVPSDPEVATPLLQRLLDAPARDHKVIREALFPYRDSLVEGLWDIAQDPQESPKLRFAASLTLASFDPENPIWENPEFARWVVDHLVNGLPSELEPWRESLRPIKERLRTALVRVFRDKGRGEQERTFATTTLVAYFHQEPESLFDWILDANRRQFLILREQAPPHQDHIMSQTQSVLSSERPEDSEDSALEHHASRQANAALIMLYLGNPEPAWRTLQHAPDPTARSFLIDRFSTHGFEARVLIRQLEWEKDTSARRALLHSLSIFNPESLTDSERTSMEELALEFYGDDPDAGVHAAARRLLYHLDGEEDVAEIDDMEVYTEESLHEGELGSREWYVNTQGQTYSIVDVETFVIGSPETEVGRRKDEIQHERVVSRTIAVSTHEVTKAQWRSFVEDAHTFDMINHPMGASKMLYEDSPAVGISWFDAAHYCNWLNELEGIPEDQWPYRPHSSQGYGPEMTVFADFPERSGYRIPTEAEWEFLCRAHTKTPYSFGLSTELLPHYAWNQSSGQGVPASVGGRLANDFGLFDMHGNVSEWCHENHLTPTQSMTVTRLFREGIVGLDVRMQREGSFGNDATEVRSAARLADRPDYRATFNGFRPVRTVTWSRED